MALRLCAQSAKDNGSPVLAYMVEMLASAAGRAARVGPRRDSDGQDERKEFAVAFNGSGVRWGTGPVATALTLCAPSGSCTVAGLKPAHEVVSLATLHPRAHACPRSAVHLPHLRHERRGAQRSQVWARGSVVASDARCLWQRDRVVPHKGRWCACLLSGCVGMLIHMRARTQSRTRRRVWSPAPRRLPQRSWSGCRAAPTARRSLATASPLTVRRSAAPRVLAVRAVSSVRALCCAVQTWPIARRCRRTAPPDPRGAPNAWASARLARRPLYAPRARALASQASVNAPAGRPSAPLGALRGRRACGERHGSQPAERLGVLPHEAGPAGCAGRH
jgi:hypothetical protein